MLNLKALLTNLCQSLVIESGTPAFTITTGTLVSATYRRFRKVVFMQITFRNTASVASGSDILVGQLTTTALTPIMDAPGVAYYTNHTLVGYLGESRTLSVRNASTTAVSTGSSNTITMSFTYIIA